MRRAIPTFCLSATLLFLPCGGGSAQTPEQGEAAPLPSPSTAQLPAQRMNNARLGEILARVGADLRGEEGNWRLTVQGLQVMVITDQRADRMRIVIPIKSMAEVSAEELLRLMQANFDSALDARYAVAKGTLWATYIHPLSLLTDREFLLGLGQTVNIVRTFGRSYSSGILLFGGGDSSELLDRALIEELIQRGEVI